MQTLQLTFLITTWLLIGAIFVGLGLLLIRRPEDDDLFRAFWVGLGVTLLGLQIWHLIRPVTVLPFYLLLALGVVGLSLHWRLIVSVGRRFGLLRFGTLMLLAVIVAFSALNSYTAYDDGLYHLQDLRWVQTYSLVPGLGNLHWRLALNNTLTLLWAMLDSVSWLPPIQYVGNTLLAMAAATTLLWYGGGLIDGTRRTARAAYSLLVIPALVGIGVISLNFASLKNDYAVFVLGLLVGGELLAMLEGSARARQVIYLTLLAATAVAIKLSFAVYGAVAVVVAVAAFWRASSPQKWRVVLIVGGIAATTGSVWVVRGLILSGYPLYPQTFLALPVDWQVPTDLVEYENRLIRSWARQPAASPDVVLSDWAWLSGWWARVRINAIAFWLPMLLGGGGLLAGAVFRRKSHRGPSLLWLWFVPVLAGLLVWFFTAPDLRFSWHLFWMLGAGIPAVAYVHSQHRDIVRWLVVLATFALVLYQATIVRRTFTPEPSTFRPVPTVAVDPYETASGLTLYRPQQGDRCFDAPLPCTPYVHRSIELRDPAGMGAGFRRE